MTCCYPAAAQSGLPWPAMAAYQAPVYGPANTTQISYLRVYNSASTPGVVEFTYVNPAAARLLVVKEPVPARASLQFQVSTHLSRAGSTNVAAVYVRANFDGLLSHVVWNAAGGSLTNMTSCGAEIASQTHTLMNVHTSLISEYPSVVGVYNRTTAPRSATLTVYDSVTGAEIGRVQTNPVLSQTTSMLDVPSLLSTVPAAQRIYHVNIALDPAFGGHLVHYVDNLRSRVITNMKDACVLVGDRTLN